MQEPESPADQRYHALDFLRGTLMLAVIALHAAIAYAPHHGSAVSGLWPTSDVLKYLIFGAPPVPLFFVLAGFFCVPLYSRRNTFGFVSNVSVRIGLPLLVGWTLFSAAVGAGIAFSLGAMVFNRDIAWEVAWQMTKQGEFFFLNSSLHLWFLYYLLFFYAGFLAVRKLGEWVLRPDTSRAQAWIRRGLAGHWRVPLLALPTIALLGVQPLREATAPTAWTPDIRFLVVYGGFFAAGAMIYSARDVLWEFRRGAWGYLVAGIALFVLFHEALPRTLDGGSSARVWAAGLDVMHAFFIWAMFFGAVGLLLRVMERPVPAVRYVADASYWCFFSHCALLVWIPGLLAAQGWAPELKFLFVFTLVTVVCFLSYELFVRWSIIGRVLNGRTYPSGLASLLRRVRRKLSRPASPELERTPERV